LAAVRADPALRGVDYCAAWSATVDQWLAGLFTAATAEAGSADGLALVAVGGYGRQ